MWRLERIRFKMGVPAWNAANPCFLCDISLEQLRRGDDQFTLRDTESYCQACQEAENWTMIPDADLHAKVRYALVSTTAGRGRHLSEDVPELLLQAGDRLDPQPMLQDVMDFDTLEPPFVVCFWRTRDAPIVHRRHPLLTEELGIGLHSFSIDILHTSTWGYSSFGWRRHCVIYCSAICSTRTTFNGWKTRYVSVCYVFLLF